MKYRIIAAIVLSVVVVGLGGSSLADTKTGKARGNQLVALLPASDGVVTLDGKRFFNDVPQVLSGSQAILGKIVRHLDEFKTKSGVDARQFDEIAAGFTTRQVAVKNYDVDAVVIARGQTPSASHVSSAKTINQGKLREEQVGGRVMYIFNDKVNVLYPGQGVVATHELAMAALDDRTLAFGDVARVRLTLEGKTRVGSDLVGMLDRGTSAVAAFAIKPPAGLRAYIPLDSDELGRNIDSIQYIYGNVNFVAGSAALHVTARTQQSAQAASLLETMQGLQVIGKAFLGGSKAADKRVYASLIEKARLSAKANEVSLDLSVPQSDIDVLVGLIK